MQNEDDPKSIGHSTTLINDTSNYEEIKGAFKIKVPDTEIATQLIIKHPEKFKDYEITKGDMDDVFLAVTGKKLGEEA